MSNQLVKNNPTEGYQNVFPKTFIDAIKDKESGASLQEILQGFNMYFLSYNGSKALTRCKIPTILRKEGLWITYVLYDHTVVTEWYNSDQIDDNSWSMDSNWRVASNSLVGDVSVSADGYWVINGEKTEAKAQGEQGVTPLLRIGANNKLQVSYNAGKAWKDISDYIVPRFRWNQGAGTTAGTIQISMDLGNTWTNLSNEITNNLRISRYIGINESLPTSGVAEGTVYMKGPYYDEGDTSNANPIYRMWVYAWKGDVLAWQDNGEFTSISAGVVQERGTSTIEVMSQAAVTKELTELESELQSAVGGEFAIDMTGQPGRISGTSGDVIEDSFYTHTYPFFVKSGSVVNFSVACVASGCALAETDVNGTSYSVLLKGIDGSEVRDFSYTAPRDMYLSITYRNALAASGKVIVDGELKSSIKHQAMLTLLPIQRPYVITGNFVSYTTGDYIESGVNSAITEVDISGNGGNMLYYSRVKIPSSEPSMKQGMAFFDENGYISGVQGTLNASEWGISIDSVKIPDGAIKARFTCPTAELDNFQVYIEQQSILGKLNSVEETLEINHILSESENWQKLFINSEGHCSISTNTLCTKRKNFIGKNTYLHVKVDSGYKYRILFFESFGTGIIGENTTYSLIPGEYDDINVWHIDERLLSLPIGATCFTINIRKIDDSEIEVSDCEHLYVYNTYGIENISTFYNLLKKENKNILSNNISYLKPKVITHNGVTYTFNGFSWSVTGQATKTSWASIAGDTDEIPQGIDVGKLVTAKYSGTNVALHIVQYDSNSSVIQSQFIYNDSSVSIDARTKGIEIRLRVAQGAIVNEEVNPVIINFLDNDDLSKELYNVVQHDVNERNDRIVQCAKSYYNVTRANQFVYGKRSALYYPDYDPEYNPGDDTVLNQVHCGALTYLMAVGCPYYLSRYVNPNGVNASYAAGYGFDFEAYSLRLAHAGNEDEIAYIGADNINKTTEELKELMLFKTSYKLATSCLRWNMLIYIQNEESVDTSKMKIGDMVFYGHPDDGQPKYIDGVLQTPILIEGYRISHCDTVVDIIDGTPYVIDAGAAPISFHPFSKGSFEYVCIGRVPLFDF